MLKEGNKVLIADDIPENLQVLSNILYGNGFEVGIAMDGLQAIEAVKENPPNLILLDINMPNLDGFEVCKLLKSNEKTKDIPIIFLTAKADSEDIVEGLKLGAVDYITKPFKSDELLLRVSTHIELSNSRVIIKNQLKELSSLNKTKDKFFSIIAHDLKGPINGLVGLSDMLVEDFEDLDDEQLKQIHKVIQETSKTGLMLLKNLLEWSRVQIGKIAFEPTLSNFHKCVEEAKRLVAANAELKKLNIENKVNTETEFVFDKNMINTVLRNLINNAIKFTPNNGTISIEAKIGNDEIEVSIIDNGIGIDEETQSKLFKIEEHITTKGTNNEKGTGLGLIICKEYIQKHNGTINVISKPNEGSKFYFTIPLNLNQNG